MEREGDPRLMYRSELPEGRRAIARMVLVSTSIEVTSALLMSDELSALPVADDGTFPRLLALRTTSQKYIGGTPSLAPLLGLRFARAVIPDEALRKLEFKDIFEYRKASADSYHGWTIELDKIAAKINNSEFSNPVEAIDRLIAAELMPKLTGYESEMISIRDKLFDDLIKGVVSWQLPTISAAYFYEHK
jgi:hypothetical protein